MGLLQRALCLELPVDEQSQQVVPSSDNISCKTQEYAAAYVR